MPANIINSFVKKTNKSKKEIEAYYKKARKEASDMGMEHNEGYVISILKTMLGIKESVENIKEFTDEFIKSKEDFNKFYETLTAGGLESGVLPDTFYYDDREQEVKDNEDEELRKKYKIVRPDKETKDKLKVQKNYKK